MVSTEISEPLINKSILLWDIQDNIISGSMLEESIVFFLYHSQAVERTLKIATKIASNDWDHDKINAAIKDRDVKMH